MNDNTRSEKPNCDAEVKLAAFKAIENRVEAAIREMHEFLDEVARLSPGLIDNIASRFAKGVKK